MFRVISRQAWPAFLAMVVAVMAALPAGAQDAVPNEITSGRVPAAELNENFQHLVDRIKDLEGAVDNLASSVDGLTARQPAMSVRALDFGHTYKPDSNGLVIAFFTVPAEHHEGGEIQAKIDARVDPNVALVDEANLTELRATDSFLATNSSKDRSATIVMPVMAGEYYQIELSISERPVGETNFVSVEFDPERYVRNGYFLKF